MKKRKIPMRKDVVTGEMAPKKELIRIVRDQNGDISIDETGKKSGRGAYISINVDIAKKARDKKILEKTFSTSLDDQFYEDLIAYVDHKQARKELFENGQ